MAGFLNMNDVTGNAEPTWRLITELEEATRAIESLLGEPIVGLDTETYWDRADNRSLVSLVQVAPHDGETLVLDVLAVGIEPLRPLVEGSDVKMAAHNARFDEGVLSSAGLKPCGFIDTLRLARTALDLPSYSLAAVTEHLFGLPLDKSLQNSNWRRRPLTRAQLAYAAMDAVITLRVYEELRLLLGERGDFDKALRAATLEEREPRPPRKRRVVQPPAVPLTAEEKRMVAHLKRWRLERSRAQRVPAYMVCPDRTLEHLARARPATLEALNEIHGLGASKIENFGEELLQALRGAIE